jgi:membrane dipeptidase
MSTSTVASSSDFYKDALVWDAHAGVFPDPKVDLTLLNDWRDNGVNYLSINVGFDVMDWQQTLSTLAAYRRWLLLHEDRFILAGSVEDILRAKQENKLAISFDIEGMNALNGDLNMVGVYHALGVRQMLFAYNLNNEAAGGCHDSDMGLTDFGRAIVSEMNRVGMIVDCSHAAYRTTMDIMAESTIPVVFSHSNPTAICDHQRNIRDEQIKACAETGGVVGINGMGIFLETGLDIGTILSSRPDFWPAGQRYDTPGIKHAAPSQLSGLADCLNDRGFSDNQIRGVLGENFRRVAATAWSAGLS